MILRCRATISVSNDGKPKWLYNGAMANVTIKDNGGVLHILRLRDPLMLPPPNGTESAWKP